MTGHNGGGAYLVVNADDFGRSPAINAGIERAHEHGIVTSASLMVRWPAAESAVAYAREHRRMGLGLHLDLGEWSWNGETWQARYERVAIGDPAVVAREVEGQLALFRRLVGKDPTHLDSHQEVHLRKTVRPVVIELALRLGIPLWGWTPGVRHVGSFYGQTSTGDPLPEAIGVEALLEILRGLGPGATAVRCHPGGEPDTTSDYRAERSAETRTLCDPRVLEAVESRGITLCNFSDRSFLP